MSTEAAFRIINQADSDYCLAIRARKVMLAVVDPNDAYQIWIKTDTTTKDQEGQPAFALVNKATNEAMNHVYGGGPDSVALWTVSKNDEQDFWYIRQANDIMQHLTANSHTVREGIIVNHSTGNHISERWKFVPVKSSMAEQRPEIMISSSRKDGYKLTIRDNKPVLAPADPDDKNQIWIKDI